MQINSTAGAHYLPLFGASAPTGLADRQVNLFTEPVTSVSAFLPLLRENWPVPANSDQEVTEGSGISAGLSYGDWVRETEDYLNAVDTEVADTADSVVDTVTSGGGAETTDSADAAASDAADDAAAEEQPQSSDQTASSGTASSGTSSSGGSSSTGSSSGGSSSGSGSSGGGGLLGGLFGWR